MKIIIRDIIILICLCLVLIFLWFSKGLIFAGGEEGIPFYDLNNTIRLVSFSWQDISAGIPTQLLLNRIPYFTFLNNFSLTGFPGFLIQSLHFFLIMAFGSVSLYFLLRETVAKELEAKNAHFQLVPLIGAIFYLLNPFSMTQIWGRGLYLQFFPFALFPFLFLMFILGLKYKNFIFGVLGLFASVFLAGSYGNPSYIFSQWIILVLYLIYYIIRFKTKKEILFSLFYFLFMLVGWVALHMWWIYPFIKISSNQFSLALNNSEANLGTLLGISPDYKLPSLLRLIHEGYFYRDQKYGYIYSSPLFMLISWLIPLVALFAYPIFKKLKIFLFFGTFFLFSLFICLGANKPTGFLFIFIFETFPAFQALRNPFEKFGIVLTIAYSPFFAIGTIVVSQWLGKVFRRINSNVFVLGILVLVCGIFLWPIWTGQFAGGIKISPWVEVPDYYAQLDKWLNGQKDDGRIIHLPINMGDGLRYSGWEHPYQGIEPGEYIFTRSSIGKNGQSIKPYYNVLLQRFNNFHLFTYGPDPDLTNSEFRSENLNEELAKLNVRYIILHRDIDPELGNFGQPEIIDKYLESQKNIKKIDTFGKLEVYQVDIPPEIHLIYSPDTKITYLEINPTQYSIDITDAKASFNLYFLENFDENWELYVDDKKVDQHSLVFSYANKWMVEKTGSFRVTLKYKPQDFVYEGTKISKQTVLVLGFICLPNLFILVKRKKKE